MKSKDQQLLEEAYQTISEGKYLKDYGMYRNVKHRGVTGDPSLDAREADRNAGVVEQPYRPVPSPAPVDKPYQNRIGQVHIKISPGSETGIRPGTYRLDREIYTPDGSAKFKIVWNKETNKAEKIDLGPAEKIETTQWGVKDVPGGDID